MSTEKEKKDETGITESPPVPLAMTKRGFEPTSLGDAWRMANALANSALVPEQYRGNPDSCLIAIDLALRLQSSWLMVMQHVYDVKGRLGMDGQLCVALMNQSGLFTDPLDYEVVGQDPFKEDFKVRAVATRKKTGKVLYGPWITWDLVKAEGWNVDTQRRGGGVQKSKWNTMPEQMFHYRAASWFKSRHCPEVTMGMMTTDEAAEIPEDTYEATQAEASARIESEAGSEPIDVNFENTEEADAGVQAKVDDEKQKMADAEAADKKGTTRRGRRKKEPEPPVGPDPDPSIVDDGVDQETGECSMVCLRPGCRKVFDEPAQSPGLNGPIYKCPHCGSLRIEGVEPQPA